MEETKYYTPQIEEFHVGFELEIKTHELKNWEKHTWLPGDQASSVAQYLEQIRVKYLSGECVKSFGFKVVSIDAWDTTYTRDKVMLRVHEDGAVEIYNNYIKDAFMSVRFRGKIKNKSALKIILQQLEII